MPNTIQPGEPAARPRTRSADALTRMLTAASETLYDYSGGRYGLAPANASDVRRAREQERERAGADARPVVIVESHPTPAPARRKRRALPLVLVGVVALASIVALVLWQRRRMQRLSAGAAPTLAREPGGPLAPTPTFERVVRGELLPHPRVAPASARPSSPTTGHDGYSRGSVASEAAETNQPSE